MYSFTYQSIIYVSSDHHLCIYVSKYLSIIYMSIYLSIICVFIYLSIIYVSNDHHLCTYLSMYLSIIYVSTYISRYLSIFFVSMCLSIYLFINHLCLCVSVYLRKCLWILILKSSQPLPAGCPFTLALLSLWHVFIILWALPCFPAQYQTYLVSSLPRSWNPPFSQGALVLPVGHAFRSQDLDISPISVCKCSCLFKSTPILASSSPVTMTALRKLRKKWQFSFLFKAPCPLGTTQLTR